MKLTVYENGEFLGERKLLLEGVACREHDQAITLVAALLLEHGPPTPAEPEPEPEPEAGEGESETGDLEPAEITLDLQGLAQSYEWQIVDASPIPPGPGGQGFPRHLVMGFDGQNPLEASYTERRIMYIFPVAEYTGLYSGQGNESVAQQVIRLEELIATAAGRQSDPEGAMPLLPP